MGLAAILISHPAVSDAAVIGIYDEAHATELPKAYAVAIDSAKSSDALTHEVLTYVNSRVANYKKLRGGLEWIQAIPKNVSGAFVFGLALLTPTFIKGIRQNTSPSAQGASSKFGPRYLILAYTDTPCINRLFYRSRSSSSRAPVTSIREEAKPYISRELW